MTLPVNSEKEKASCAHSWRIGRLGEFPSGYVGCARCSSLRAFDALRETLVGLPLEGPAADEVRLRARQASPVNYDGSER